MKNTNKKAAKLVYAANGVLELKECKHCTQMLPPTSFRTSTSPKHSKVGLVTYCIECERVRKANFRRTKGMLPAFVPRVQHNESGTVTHKECSNCHELKTLTDYTKQKRGRYGLRAICTQCSSSQECLRTHGLSKEFKLSEYEKQEGKCKICKTPYSIEDLYIDHNHAKQKGESGYFRALLCNNCNWAYGAVGDGSDNTPNMLFAMLGYYLETTRVS